MCAVVIEQFAGTYFLYALEHLLYNAPCNAFDDDTSDIVIENISLEYDVH